MTSQRIKKVNSLLGRRVADVLSKELETSDYLFTVTKVDTSPDLRYSDVFLSVYPDHKSAQALRLVAKHASQISRAVFINITLRVVPKLRFHKDSTESRAQDVETILKSIQDEQSYEPSDNLSTTETPDKEKADT